MTIYQTKHRKTGRHRRNDPTAWRRLRSRIRLMMVR